MARTVRITVAAALLAPAVGLAGGYVDTAKGGSHGGNDGHGRVPTPESVIGWEMCADYQLATHEQISEYFYELDEASDRIEVVEVGESTLGRPQLMAVISSEENLEDLDRYKEIAQRLARAEGLTDEQARELAAEGKAVAWADFGIHSTEVAPTQSSPILAHTLVTEESEEVQEIRENVITLLVPDVNPDGTTQVADWYLEHVGTEFEDAPLPELYHPYAGHDNNRDWYMFNLEETRNLGNQLYHEWYPQVMHNAHQTGPFPARITVPPFSDPVNPNIDPRVVRGVNLVGTAMAERLDREGKVGAVSQVQYDMWWNGGMRSAPYYHNQIGILTETQHNTPTPMVYDPAEFPETFANGESTTEPSVFYPSPWMGGEWQLRDSCDYITTANMAMLDLAAERRTDLLYGIYEMGRDAIEAGDGETYVVPADQTDFPTAVEMIRSLRWGGIDVEQVTEPFTVDDREYPENSFIIRGDQAFRAHLTDLLNPQVYPDRRLYPDGPPDPPYDISGWTLPIQMGVEVDRLDVPVEAQTEPVDTKTPAPPAGRVTGRTDVAYALDPQVNNTVTAVNRLLASGASVARTQDAVETSAGQWPAGTYLVTPERGTHRQMRHMARDLGLTVGTVEEIPDDAATLEAPRIGLYHGYDAADDQGWMRLMFDRFEFPYSEIYDADVRAGDLAQEYDVIVLPDDDYEQMLEGMDPEEVPAEYAGGMTAEGVQNVETFVEAGGVLVALDSATEIATEGFGVPVTDVTEGLPEEEFFIPGTLLEVQVDNTHPLGYGMPERASAFFARSPAFEVPDDSDLETFASYPEGDLVQSGWALGEELLHGTSAAVTAELGEGEVVMLGFRAQHRVQAHGTFKLFFNALYQGGMQ